jgi:hypothetical protein
LQSLNLRAISSAGSTVYRRLRTGLAWPIQHPCMFRAWLRRAPYNIKIKYFEGRDAIVGGEYFLLLTGFLSTEGAIFRDSSHCSMTFVYHETIQTHSCPLCKGRRRKSTRNGPDVVVNGVPVGLTFSHYILKFSLVVVATLMSAVRTSTILMSPPPSPSSHTCASCTN